MESWGWVRCGRAVSKGERFLSPWTGRCGSHCVTLSIVGDVM